jgi:2-methylcitrate dehydratase PrpD
LTEKKCRGKNVRTFKSPKYGAEMAAQFIERVCDLIESPRALEAWEQAEVLTAFEDTMAVAYAGWHDRVVQATLKVYRGTVAPLIDGTFAASIEHAALIHATAGHALDYDDVQLTTVSHPSVPLVPALLAVSNGHPELAGRMQAAFAVGLTINIALGSVMGFSHYDKGWHATSTLGPMATAAAVAHLLSLDRTQIKNALAIAAAQAGGAQRNFGSDAKPLQAGLAAAAGVRAALLAGAGLTGDADIFGRRGYFDLYAGSEPGEDAASVSLAIDLRTLSRKMFPCCYMNHRLISAGFDARDRLPGRVIPDDARIVVKAPFGSLVPLRVDDPKTGLEAKFCGPYNIAAALSQGKVTLSDFEDAAVSRPNIRALMDRIDLSEEARAEEVMIGLDQGSVKLWIESEGKRIVDVEIDSYPGSPRRPATTLEMDTKIDDCLGIYRRRTNHGPTLPEFRADMRAAIGA